MATEQEIKAAILKAAGNPVSGPIASLAGDMAAAVVALDAKEAKSGKPNKETRVVEVHESRSEA